jgi:hypothetical protein
VSKQKTFAICSFVLTHSRDEKPDSFPFFQGANKKPAQVPIFQLIIRRLTCFTANATASLVTQHN